MRGCLLPLCRSVLALLGHFALSRRPTDQSPICCPLPCQVYDLMEASGIDVPRHVYMSRDGYVSEGSGGGDPHGDNILHEHDDHIEINGVEIHKPFVEKPVDADDHNVHIYYPTSAGGGCKKLFRKVKNRSSEFYEDIHDVRKDGSFIYEEFVETQGTDVKMYTVGPDYGHAEARKSPVVDGKVNRDSDGREVRYPVILSLREKEIARRIVLVFKQQVCGFDLLRVQEGDSLVSYCCDVNGWSFVKNSRKYYDDCAQLLSEYMLAAVKPRALQGFSALDPLLSTYANISETPAVSDLDGVDGGNGITNPDFFDDPDCDLASSGGSLAPPAEDMEDREVVNINSSSATAIAAAFPATAQPTTLSEGAPHVREISNELSRNPGSRCSNSNGNDVANRETSKSDQSQGDSWKGGTPSTHQEELRCVIAVIRHGDRTPKQKLKLVVSHPLFLDYYHSNSDNPKKDLKIKAKQPLLRFLSVIKTIITEREATQRGQAEASSPDGSTLAQMKALKKELYKLTHMRNVLERWKISGLNRKLQIKPLKWNDAKDRCAELQLIMKWGGNLTKLGEKQAMSLGQRFRHDMYPDPSGGGILRLHSTFRHDLKIKTSDEGRVMKTAAAFAKGLLELEGDLPPILVSLVHKEKDSMHMLDPSGNKEVKVALEKCKTIIHSKLQADVNFSDLALEDPLLTDLGIVSSESSLFSALNELKNPQQRLHEIRGIIGELLQQLDDMLTQTGSGDEETVNEEGEGLKAHLKEEEGLSGIKLYKGETLIELTERWRLLYKKLFDDDTGEFDLTKIPDVHDNVRFDMLHNPHLGLTATLNRLYKLAKLMADCVVPQEYGISIEDKREVGTKMCRALIEKIKYDLIIAKTDNEVDMRYMIDMSHSADLAINTLGRRIRTRLYFTSESHLHTLLNVLRFMQHDTELELESPLDKDARKLIREAPELCYLTQIVLRLFEDPKKKFDDPKRFRVEIGFSAGATAPPSHMSEKNRDDDSARFDTDELKTISKEMLTCDELEDYLDQCIEYGYTKEESEDENEKKKKKKKRKEEKSVNNKSVILPDNLDLNNSKRYLRDEGLLETPPVSPPKGNKLPSMPSPPGNNLSPGGAGGFSKGGSYMDSAPPTPSTPELRELALEAAAAEKFGEDGGGTVLFGGVESKSGMKKYKASNNSGRTKWIWGSAAALSFSLGLTCAIMAKGIKRNR